MAQYLLSVHTVEGEARASMTNEQMQEFVRNVHELERDMTSAGALVYSGRLQGAESAKVVSVTDGKALTTDGPFAETREHIGGFYIINAANIEEALSWAKKTSECVAKAIEVRPFADMRGA